MDDVLERRGDRIGVFAKTEDPQALASAIGFSTESFVSFATFESSTGRFRTDWKSIADAAEAGPAAADHELRRITDPSLVRGRGHEVLTEDIRRDGLGMITQRGALEPSPHPRRQPLGLF